MYQCMTTQFKRRSNWIYKDIVWQKIPDRNHTWHYRNIFLRHNWDKIVYHVCYFNVLKESKVKHTFTTQHQTIPFSNIIHLDHLENISVCTCTQATFLGVTFWLWGPYLTYTHILLLENFLAAKLATFNVLTLVWLVINQQK